MATTAQIRAHIRAERLTAADWRDSTFRAVLSVTAYVGSLTLASVWGNPLGWVVAWVVAAFVLAGAFAAVHEAIHGSLYRSGWANHLAGMLWGAVIVNSYASYRSFHFHHHVYTRREGDSEPVIEIRSVLAYLMINPWPMLGLNAILARNQVLLLVGRPVSYAARTGSRRLAVVNTVVMIGFVVTVWAAAGFDLATVAAWWLIPLLLGGIIAGLFSVSEHYGCPLGLRNSFLNSRTVETNPVVRFLIWNANYHTAHHLAPMVCGRNLHRLQAMIGDRCEVKSRSFTAFHLGAIADLARRSRSTSTSTSSAGIVIDDGPQTYDERAGRREPTDAVDTPAP